MIMLLLGLIPAMLFVLVMFLINPILGVLSVIGFIGLGIYTWRKN